jgi:hypothetical protein
VFEESRWHAPSPLPVEQVHYLRSVLSSHANDPATGRCPLCGVSGCLDWRNAYDHLAAAGELMAEPDWWLHTTQTEG